MFEHWHFQINLNPCSLEILGLCTQYFSIWASLLFSVHYSFINLYCQQTSSWWDIKNWLIESCSVSQARKQNMLTALQQCRSRSLWHPKINIHAPCCHRVPVAVARHVVCLLSLACVEKAWINGQAVCMHVYRPASLSFSPLFVFVEESSEK